jgi:hypothetical protein
MLTILIALAAMAGSSPLKLETSGDQWIVRAVEGGNADISVRLDSADANLPPVLGAQSSQGRDRIFTPRFPFQPGVRYHAMIAGFPPLTFELPSSVASSRSRVTHVFPSANVLPENQLKFYIEFATAMTRGEAYRRIRLLDANDRPIELPFLELEEELWDAGQQRFTLYFDPGRVKSELTPNREVGSPLRAGQRYTLVVDAGWKDAHGQALASEYRKSFSVGARDESTPDPKHWRIHLPAPATREPLTIDFREPLEHALALRMIDVADGAQRTLSGRTQLSQEESRWTFMPDDTWVAGSYFLIIDAALEDLAGNKISRPFEGAIRTDAQRKAAPTSISIAVQIGTLQ